MLSVIRERVLAPQRADPEHAEDEDGNRPPQHVWCEGHGGEGQDHEVRACHHLAAGAGGEPTRVPWPCPWPPAIPPPGVPTANAVGLCRE